MSQVKFLLPIAVAVEAFAKYPGLEREPGAELSRRHTLAGVGSVVPAYATDQVRLCTVASSGGDSLKDHLLRLQDFIEAQGDGLITFDPVRRPGNRRRLRPVVSRDPAYLDLLGLKKVADKNQVLRGLADTGSTLIDFDVSKLPREEKLLCLNLLNAAAPTFLQVVQIECQLSRSGRHRVWQYLPCTERLPLSWRWQADWQSYEQQIMPHIASFPHQAERFANHDVFGSGVFHFAQLHSATGRDVIRLWVLPTLYPVQVMFAVKTIDAWLREAIAALRGKQVTSLEMASEFLPDYRGVKIFSGEAARLYSWERF